MSNITVVDPYIATLSIIQMNILRYVYSILFIAGNIGCILNILIFTQRNYRRHSCSAYILANTFTNLIVINIIIFFRFVNGFNIDPTMTTLLFCKIRLYIAQVALTLSRIYIVLACIDRWALTSRNVRIQAFAQIKIPKILIPSIAILLCAMTITIPFYQDIVKGQCVTTSTIYSMYFNVFNIIVCGVIIPVSMIVFSLLYIRNVKQLQQRVQPHRHIIFINVQTPRQNIANKKSYDYQLLLMIFVEQCFYVITNIPFISYLFYSAITLNWPKSNIQTGIDNFYMIVTYTIGYANFSLTFYIYALTGSTFRKDLKRLLFHNHLMNMFFTNQQNLQVRG